MFGRDSKSTYRCETCGQIHEGPVLGYRFDAPFPYHMIPEAQRAARVQLNEETCIIDGNSYFILGNLELQIIGSDQKFVWSPWVSLSEKNFKRAIELWHETGREQEPPYFGWLCSWFPTYPALSEVKTLVHTRAVGLRPLIELEPTDFLLSREQRDGLTWERVHQINAAIEHGKTAS